ncbi:MAG TPA: ABC transporter substrate-binding protein [Xanthobacteraceae bacterium]|jgi:NitT/TauT family transport system substrate-binding protein
MNRRRFLVSAAAVGTAIAGLPRPAKAQDKVALRLDWVFGTEHSGIWVAQEKGFFKDENLDVRILPGEGSSVTVKLVGTGDVEFGYATADQAMLAYSRALPVVTTAVILQSSPTAIVFPKSTGIKKLTDLYGKRLGLQLKSAVERQWQAVAKINHIDTSKITQVPADLAIAQLIIAGRIDAGVAFFFNDGIRPIAEGIDMDWILFRDVGLPMYSSSLIVNADTIQKKPDLVARFTRAFVRGWEYAKAHPDEAFALTVKAQPTLDNKYNKLKLPAVLTLLASPDVQKNGIGHSDRAGWEALQKALTDVDLLKEPVDLDKVFTNKFLPKPKS